MPYIMATTNSDDFSQFLLKKGIREDVVKKLLDENVDGDSLVDLNEEDLKSIDIKLGDRKRIMRIVKEMKLSNEYATANALGSDTVQGVEGTDITINSVCSLLGNTYTLEATSSRNEGNTKNMTSSSTVLPNLSEESRATNTSHHLLPFSSPEAINIKDILNKSARGKILLRRFQRPDSNSISRKYVNQLVRICVHSMVTDLETVYPTSFQKKNLAKAIVSAFPILKSSRDNVEGYEYLFDSLSRTGIIEWRLKTLRVKLSPSQKKYRRRIPATFAVEFEENDSSIASKITWLQNQVPSSLHKAEIMEAMKATFQHRRNYILNNNPSMSEVLKAYPKFKDFGGLLIDAEFKEIYPDVGDFPAIFPTQYAPRILKYVRENRLDIYERLSFEEDENFSALLMLADLLPVSGLRKKIKDSGSPSLVPLFPSDALIRFIGANSCLEEAVRSIQEKQPYILCVEGTDVPGNFFLILDEELINVGMCGLKAFDLLYKSHYIFNVKCCDQLATFFNWMDCVIYKLVNGPARSSVENLNNLLNAIVI